MVYDYYKEMTTRRKKSKLHIFVILIAVFVVLAIGAGIYSEVVQFNEMGNFALIFITNLKFKFLFSTITFAVVFATFYFTNLVIKNNYQRHSVADLEDAKPFINWPIAILFALIGALLMKDFFYDKALMFFNSVPFGKVDPLFNNDIGFYLFTRPLLYSLYEAFSSLWMTVIIYSFVYYFILGILSVEKIAQGNFNFESIKLKPIIKHNLINIAVFFLIKTVSFVFQKQDLLYSNFEDVSGAGFTDVKIWLNYYTIAPFILVAIVGVAMMFIWKGKYKKAVLSIATYPAIWFVVSVVAALVQSLMVHPSVPKYESQYLKNNINMTREAYGIDKIIEKNFSSIKEITPELLEKNKETKENIRIVDYNSTLINNQQLQTISNFYGFKDGDIVNYKVDGKEMPVFITAREVLEGKNLPEKSYLSTRFRFTHGYGVSVNPMNQVGEKGQVNFIISNLVDNKAKIKQPEIYYGENTFDYVLTNPATSEVNEVDYDGNAATRYKGTGGIKLSFINRLLFSFKYADYNMLVSSYVNSETKILLNRQIVARAQKALPFLTVDTDPYIMIGDDGKLKWIIDAYTSSENYPYAQNISVKGMGSINYIRNSVKIVLDAYDGSMKCYITDKNDPIINVYKKIYPQILTDEQMPDDVKRYMKYPELLFEIQTKLLKRYHMSSEKVNDFISNIGLWDISKHFAGIDKSDITEIEPFYNSIKLPEGVSDKEEFVLMRTFSPSGKDKHNMSAWLAVRNSFDKYGEMVLYKFSDSTNILGPYQVAVKINQNTEISQLMTLLGTKGSIAYKGNLMVVPIEDAILYVEPLYIKAEGSSSTPEIKKIVVGYQKGDELQYGVGDDLDEALDAMFKRNTDENLVKANNSSGEKSKTTAATGKTGDNTNNINPTQTPSTTPSPKATNGTDGKPKNREALIKELGGKYENIKKEVDDMGKMLEELKSSQ